MHHQHKDILIIDNQSSDLPTALKSVGYKITFAFDEKEIINNVLFDKEYDLIIFDRKMSKINGWELIEIIRNNEINKTTPVIIINSQYSRNYQIYALQSGADDVISIPYESQELLARVESLLRRSEWQKKPSLRLAFYYQNDEPLTDRQIEILFLTSQGYSNKEMADKLFVSEKTVKAHLRSIFDKLNVSSRTQAALVAIKEGIAS